MNCFKVVKNNLKRSCNRPVSFAINLILPIIVAVLGVFANSVSQPSFIIGVMNATGSDNIVAALSNTNGITVAKANPDTVKIDLITGKYAAIIDFSTADYTLFSIKDDQTNHTIKHIIDTYQLSTAPVNLQTMMGASMSLAQRTVSFMMILLMVTATLTASLMIKDKNNGTLKRYKSAPQKPANYILGNMIYNYCITLSQFLICISFVKVIGIHIGISYFNLFLMGLWASGIATAFGTFVSGIFKKEMYANLFAACIALLLSLVGGSFIAYENMPGMLQKISVISPWRWLIAITANMENGAAWFENGAQIVILSAAILLLVMGAGYINKIQRLNQTHFK